MKVFVIFSICIAAAMSKKPLGGNEASVVDKERKSLIGGRPAKESTAEKYFEFPWMVSLHYQGYYLCSSFLVTPKFLMTAGHCVVNYEDDTTKDPKDFKAYMGTVKRDGPDNEANFTEVTVHEKYVNGNDYDIALLKLAKPVVLTSNIQTICLPSKDSVYENTTAEAMGWGVDRKGSYQAAETLQTLTEKVTTNSLCNAAYNRESKRKDNRTIVTRRHLCAGGVRDKGTCNGDSGGPLVVLNETEPVAIGITSFGSHRGCAVENVPAVFAATSMYTDWIVEHMGEDANDLCFVNKTSNT